ncbi:hypothetical protein GCM10009801_44410 [Streptomyces albiaxialis]|uniref:Carrier domain-containing protein n=1 Tax=Streptomyces albiaxialis TaxID=329523 RepID=A0ABP5HPU8_9ACTN
MPDRALLHELISEQARRTPGLPAVVCGEREIGYAELEERSQRLAHYLRRRGVRQETVVGLCLERGIDQIVALLAVLKAGGAYLPLDPEDPPERVAFMLGDAHAPLVLSRSGITDDWDTGACAVVHLDEAADDVGACPATPLTGGGVPGGAAYVIHTSGSTGTPKGVVVPHRAVVALVRAQRELYAHGPGERVLQLAPVRFDASVFDLSLALCNGGTLVLLPPGTVGSGSDLFRVLRDHGITTAAVLSAALQSLPDGELPALRQVVSGGESVPAEIANRWSARAAFFSAYGPTEATVISTSCPVTAPLDAPPPIGTAIPGDTVHLLDEDLNPVGPGERGEICLGGAGVAHGYAGRPAATAERFVPDPFSAEPGARLYRTGDYGHRDADGTVTFLGRADDQVKIRGFRVELGEVEARVRAVPGVREAAVVAREDTAGGKRLLAYVVPAAGDGREGRTTERTVKDALRETLPGYMVPAAVVVMDAFPTTSGGKVDRAALPEPAAERAGGEADAPLDGPLQEAVAALWAQVLGVAPPGKDDDFYELGGHSLLAAQVMARVRDTFGVDLQISALLEGPTVARLAARVEEAGGGVREDSRPARPAASQGPVRRFDGDLAAQGGLPLSFDQERLWFLSELAPGQPFYNVALGFRLTGALDLDQLRGALGALVERHGVLRTSFARVDGVPLQYVHPAAPVTLEVHEAADLAAAHETARGWLLTPFDLETGPLVRYRLLRLAPDEHVLVFVVHHIVADGWSMSLLCEELGTLYAGGELPPLPLAFADYAHWQREHLQGPALRELTDHWTARLDGLAPLELPTDHPRPAALSYAGRRLEFALPDALVEGLEAVARRGSATLFMVLLTGFDALLSRWSGQTDIAVGVPVAGRTHSSLESLMGFFVNTLVLRTDCAGDPTVLELLERVRGDAHGAFDHQELPFEKLVEELAPARDLSRNPLVQVLFHVAGAREAGSGGLTLPGIGVEPFEVDVLTTRLDLEMQVAQDATGSWSGQLVYSTELFDEPTMRLLWDRYVRVLTQIAADPEVPLSRLDILAEDERERVVHGFNATGREVPALPLHRLFEERARRDPDAVALVHGAERVGYGTLDARAERLAGALRERGAGPEDVVGVCLERGIDAVTAQLAALKTGAAFLPLSPADPADRRAYMLRTAGARLAVAAPGEPADWAGQAGCAVVAPDAAPSASGTEEAPPAATGPGNCAYTIFTSGSTGRPKGVQVPHGGIVNIALASARSWGIGPGTRVGQAVSPVFDVAVLDVYAALLSGAELHLATADDTTGDGLARFVRTTGVEVLQTVPSLWSTVDPDSGARLRCLVIGGEQLPAELIRRWRGRIDEVHHVYGLTELSVISTEGVCVPGELDGVQGPLPIGGPVDNTRVHLLDEHLAPVAVGVRGELYVGGTGVARGYAGRPALTAERFLPDPFSPHPGARMYRTGDHGRWREDGTVEFLGRADDQVKIRGFRVEPGEIEAVLLRHPGVREAVVTVREDTPGDRRLVAYTVLDGAADEAGLRAHVRAALPDFMVPAAFVTLPDLPRTTSGKADRRALPAPLAPATAAPDAAPAGAVQEAVAGIWCEVLGVESVGLEDDFFASGGHSLLAAQVISRVREVCGVELELSALLESPTLADLAERVAAAGGRVAHEGGPSRVFEGELTGRTDLPMSFGQQRLWFLGELTPGRPFYNVALGFRLRGPIDVPRLAAALDTVVERHAVLRTVFARVDGVPRQIVRDARPVELPVVDVADAHEAREQGERFGRTPFDLAADQLLRARLFRLRADEHVLVVASHHTVADGWSLSVICDEVEAAYAGRELVALALQFADVAAWQRDRLTGEALAELNGYWRERLDGLRPLELPADRPRPDTLTYVGHRLDVELPGDLVASLDGVAKRGSATLFMVFLAAFDALLSRWAGTDDIAVGVPVAGRSHRELEKLVGFFANWLVMRTDCAGDPTYLELLERVRGVVHGALDHQDLPFEKLVEELAPARDLSRNPLAQVLFQVVQPTDAGSAASARLGLDGVGVEPFHLDLVTTRADLELHVIERENGTWSGLVVYSPDLFDEVTMRRLWGRYVRVLRRIAADPETPLSALDPLPDEERDLVLHGFNEGPAGRAAHPPVHERVAALAERTPDVPAVVAGDARLTYAELLAAARDASGRLRALGAGGPGTVTAVAMEPGTDQIAAQLGVLLTGGAVTLVDPDLSPARREAALRARGADVLFGPGGETRVLARPADTGNGAAADSLPGEPSPGGSGEPSSGGSGEAPAAGSPGEPPASVPVPDGFGSGPSGADGVAGSGGLGTGGLGTGGLGTGPAPPGATAYVLPGADGRGPVLVPHRALAALGGAYGEQGPAPGDRVALLPEGDGPADAERAAVRQTWAALAAGATLVVAPREAEDAWLAEAGITVAFLTPRALARLAYDPYAEKLALRGVLTDAGAETTEGLPFPVLRHHGPAEHGLTGIAGRPSPGARVYVLDERLEPVPVGTTGRIHFGGDAVAHGYAGRAAATAGSFLPDPYAGVPGARMYASEARGRWNNDGTLTLVPAAPATPAVATGAAAPRNPVQRAVAEVWAEVLGRGPVGIYDDFRALGGGEAQAEAVAARLTARLGVAVEARTVLERPTVAEFSADRRVRASA